MLNIKKDFKWFKQNPDIVYADSGATTLKPDIVIDYVNKYLIEQSTNPHNNDSIFSYKAHKVIDDCRKLNAQFINADVQEIIFTSGATESLNLFAIGLEDFVKEGDEILLTHYEHASNLLPWFNLAEKKKLKINYVEANEYGLTAKDFEKKLTKKTKIVSFTGMSNVLGNTLPIQSIVDTIKSYNKDIFVCVDAAQYIAHKQVDVKKWGIDFLAYSGHKMFSSPGIGVAFMKTKWMNQFKPLKYGGGMSGEIHLDKFTFMNKYEKFEGGTPNVSGIYSLYGALQYFMNIGYEKIEQHEKEIYELLKKELSSVKDLVVHNWKSESSVLAFNFKGIHSQDLANYLGKKNIIVRSGLSCAKLLNHVLCQPAVVRASFYLYNDKFDILKFIEEIKKLNKEDILNELL